jgi:hypothetical protein
MKRLLLFIFSLASFSLAAQNWWPVNTSESFNFRLDNDPVVTSTIWSDSFAVTTTHTILALNTVMCDSCITIVGGPLTCDTCYGWKTKPQFLGKQMILTDSIWCNFRNPGNRLLKLNAILNESWMFDTAANVTATVIASGMSTVIGFPDSVKTVLLSTGDTIQFSKNYGIVQWPNGYGQNSYYRLVGIHGRNIGELVPRMMDYFNFDIGDMFEYHGYANHGYSPQVVTYVRKYEIVNKVVSGDSVTYSIDSYEVDTNYVPMPPSTTYYTYTGLQHHDIIFVDSADHFGNKFNNQPISLWNRTYNPFYFFTAISTHMTCDKDLSDTCFYRCDLFVDSNNLNCIHFGSVSDYKLFWGEPFYSGSVVPNTVSDTLRPVVQANLWNYQTEQATFTLKEGLGQTYANWSSHFEEMWGETLWAYRKGNDTVGVFTPQVLFDGINERPLALAVRVFPNPTSGVINVQLPANTIVIINILDLQGRIVKTFTDLDGQVSLQAGDLADGIYLLRIESPAGNGQQKIIIAH